MLKAHLELIRRRVLGAAIFGVLSLGTVPGSIFAQEPPGDGDIEEVVVTGSRLKQPNLVSPTAVNMLDSAMIDLSGAVNMSELLRTLPASGVPGITSANSNFFSDASGLNTLELRNLGEDRTLVLLNGRRFVSGSPGDQYVDFNSIPPAFIERIDVVTGGASAIYGSDALAGVVNIITKDNFQGTEVTVQSGISAESDLEENSLSITTGLPFADGRGHAMFSYTYEDEKGLYAREREETMTDAIATVRINSKLDISNYTQNTTPFYSSFSEYGRINIPESDETAPKRFVLDGGTVQPWSTAKYGFNRQAYRALKVPLERNLFSAILEFGLSDTSRIFSEMTFSSVESQSSLEPFPLSSDDIYGGGQRCSSEEAVCRFGIPGTNPYIPDEMLRTARELNPNIADEDLVFGFARRMTELDQRGAQNTRQTFRQVLGIEGEFGNSYSYELSANFGRTTQAQESTGQINVTSMRYSLDSIRDEDGNIVCRDEIAIGQGCLPVNIFGRGAITAGLDDITRRNLLTYLKAPASKQAKVEQRILSGFISGDLFDMPGGAVRFVLGAEYRDERSSSVGDALSQQGLNAGNKIPPTIGSFHVNEFFGEIEFPLLADSSIGQSLDVNIAARFSDYSTAGSTSAGAISAKYVPIDNLMVRAQFSRAVRAPNISELFQPLSQTFPNVTDPCADVTRTSGGQAAFLDDGAVDPDSIGDTTATTCLQDPNVAARVDATGSLTLTQPELQGVSGFNGGAAAAGTSLDVETADTITFGFVWTPDIISWLDGLSLSVDYYQIEISDGLGSLGRNTALAECYGADSYDPTSTFCSGITRFDSGPNIGALQFTNAFTQNLSSIETSGIDVQASYGFELPRDYGSLDLTLTLGLLSKFDTVAFEGSDTVDSKGVIGYPDYEALFGILYSRPNLVVSWESQIFDSVGFTNNESSRFHGAKVDSVMFHDIQARYTFMEWTTLVVGIDNVTDEFVPLGFSLLSGTVPTGWNTASAVYDGFGRRYYLGMRFSF